VLVIFGARGRRQMARVRRALGGGAVPTFVRRAARRTAIPFGPFLALGAVVALYCPSLTVPFMFAS
jgi:prepilin signal peptidase PulO-like enzyme (type II secretory pathway)